MSRITSYENMAMLELSDTERKVLEERFGDITGSFDKLEQYDTAGTEPLVSIIDLGHNVLREDIPAKLLLREDLLKNAPEQHDGYFQVPGTLS